MATPGNLPQAKGSKKKAKRQPDYNENVLKAAIGKQIADNLHPIANYETCNVATIVQYDSFVFVAAGGKKRTFHDLEARVQKLAVVYVSTQVGITGMACWRN